MAEMLYMHELKGGKASIQAQLIWLRNVVF